MTKRIDPWYEIHSYFVPVEQWKIKGTKLRYSDELYRTYGGYSTTFAEMLLGARNHMMAEGHL